MISWKASNTIIHSVDFTCFWSDKLSQNVSEIFELFEWNFNVLFYDLVINRSNVRVFRAQFDISNTEQTEPVFPFKQALKINKSHPKLEFWMSPMASSMHRNAVLTLFLQRFCFKKFTSLTKLSLLCWYNYNGNYSMENCLKYKIRYKCWKLRLTTLETKHLIFNLISMKKEQFFVLFSLSNAK